MIPAVDELFDDLTPPAYAVVKYCVKCTAHRIWKIGWEKEVNFFDSRCLLLLALFLPPHARVPIAEEAFKKAQEEGNQKVIAMLSQVSKGAA